MSYRGFVSVLLFCCLLPYTVFAWTSVSVEDDPLVRMPGTQPEQNVVLQGSDYCIHCHANYNQAVEPGFNWKGSMMAQAARDPIFWACMAVAAQDSIWAVGTPNAVDLCERCHFPEGWLGGRSDPPNAAAMTGNDFDGVSCDSCHSMWDPFFEGTHAGSREGNDWQGYWDEASTLSQEEADKTYLADMSLASMITTFSGDDFFAINNFPKYGLYRENVSGQYFVSDDGVKRASFADPNAFHDVFYSRYHKSKYMCGICHDVSNPVLANLGLSGLSDHSSGADQISEQYSASNYFHVERTFSEFMLSDFGQQGGAATNADFQAQGAPDILHASKCQDCHMRDVTGRAAPWISIPERPTDSLEHPASGMPLHDMTGGNAWVSHILASLDPDGPVYDSVNAQLLNQGPDVLTLDLTVGQMPSQNGAALKAGADRAKQQLRLAATIKDLAQVPDSSDITFKVQNNTGHKLISGFPEGRRMFINVKAYAGDVLVHEINPYDETVGTLKGLPNADSSPQLAAHEAYVDELVYEMHPKSDLTGEDETFHFVLATGRYKDNRIPPKGFDIANAAERLCEPVWHGEVATDYFSAAEYAGGYDEITMTLPPETDFVDVSLFYQGTSREYIEFLRDEINGTATSLPSPTFSGEAQAYILQSDPFFSKLKAWGNVIWDLWYHNHGLDGSGLQVAGIVPFEMTQSTLGVVPPPPCSAPGTPAQVLAAGAGESVTLSWQPVSGFSGGYRIYYDQAGKMQYLANVDNETVEYVDSGLIDNSEYCYVVTAWQDCNANGLFDEGSDMESAAGTVACTATAECGGDDFDGDCEAGEICVDGMCELDAPPTIDGGPWLAASTWPLLPTNPDSPIVLTKNDGVLWTVDDDNATCTGDCTHKAEYKAEGDAGWTEIAVGMDPWVSSDPYVDLPIQGLENATTYALRLTVTDCALQPTQSEYYFRVVRDDDEDGYPGDVDCDDTNAEIYQLLEGYLYTDEDLDGIDFSNVDQVCSGESLPPGYSDTAIDFDNCPDVANGPLGGTCYDFYTQESGGDCTTDGECRDNSEWYKWCDTFQSDLDGDGTGDVCE